ncbi:MAG TPA: transketolase [Patescibacteria group bacterium]|nr:transketolase [Patescibacteria group bacterium]
MNNNLPALAKLLRYYSLVSTTAAGSGHPTSSLSAADLMAALFFGGFFRYDLAHPEDPGNDRLIFSKGHASPLFYALWAAAGQVAEAELLTLRKPGSRLEGHPTMEFPYTEVPTGSLGQGLSVGLGMALAARADSLDFTTYVLLGDSEMAEGSVWEAMAVAAHYGLNNLVAIVDVNRLGQRGETMLGTHTEIYAARAQAFGWDAIVVDGHNLDDVVQAYGKALAPGRRRPQMIIGRTLKGKGVSFLEDKDGWHGKALSPDELARALAELGAVDKTPGAVAALSGGEKKKPAAAAPAELKVTEYPADKAVATRRAYGNALAALAQANPAVVALDAETSNSTYADAVKKVRPEQFWEMFIAEQNMAGAALGLARRGKIPFASTFAAFWTRAYDQIRMAALAQGNIKLVGSHAGVSIGEDGASQMGLEEIAMFRALPGSTVLYPADAVAAEKLVWAAARHQGLVYLQTTRKDTPLLYGSGEEFIIGGSKTLKSSAQDRATVIAAGVTVHEALAACEELKQEGISIRVIDLYSIKPLDEKALRKAAQETGAIITVEDNHREGGLAEAVLFALAGLAGVKFKALSVAKIPHSGKPDELLAQAEIDRTAIVKAVKELAHG